MTTLQAAALVLVVVFLITLLNKVPVSFSIILSALVTIIMFLTPQFGMFISAQKLVTGIDSFSLLAVPFFILAGQLMSSGGIAKSAIKKTAYFITSVFVAAVHAEGIGAACDEIEQLGRGHKLVDKDIVL